MPKKKDEELDVYIPETVEESQKFEPSSVSDNTVVVGLCHPHGIQFVLRDGKRVVLNGNAVDLKGKDKGVLRDKGFGLTRIATDAWEAIQAIPFGRDLVKNGVLFANPKREDTIAESDDKAEVRHGREPVDVTATVSKPLSESDKNAI